MKCSIKYVCNYNHNASTFVTLHNHDCYELVYYVKGSGTTKIGKKDYSYKKGDFVLMRPNTPHDESHTELSEMLYIGFAYEGNHIHLENGLYQDKRNIKIYHLLKQIKEEATDQEAYHETKIFHLINEIVIEFARITGATKTKGNDLSYVKNYIDEHYNQQIDHTMLAELSGYSYHHFRHLFKEKTGLSPQSYIINERVKSAKRLLANTDLSILDISHECGFSNESQFSSIFKRTLGQTPTGYRKSNIEMNY